MKKKFEFYIGVFVLVGLILVGVMIVGFSDYQYMGEQYMVHAIFNYISGVVEGAPVRYAGVDVGKVTKISIFEDTNANTQVNVTLGIKEGVRIKKDSEAVINSLGIIGEKYIEIFPGTPEAGALNPGDEILGIDPIALETVMNTAQSVLSKLEDALSSVNKVLSTDTQEDIKVTIKNFRKAGEDIDRLSNKIELVINKINQGEGTVGKLIYAQELHDELLALIKGLREHGLFYKAKSDKAKKELGDKISTRRGRKR